jgi:hypothetical protein
MKERGGKSLSLASGQEMLLALFPSSRFGRLLPAGLDFDN